MSEKISFCCVGCGHKMMLPAAYVGRRGQCPKCGNVERITRPAAAPIEATTPPSLPLEIAAHKMGPGTVTSNKLWEPTWLVTSLLVSSLSVIAGLCLGCIPVLNDYLHWNILFVIPVSGLIIGMGIGWLQFGISYLANMPLRGSFLVLFSLVALISYLAVDYGTYASQGINLTGVEGGADGKYMLSGLMSFKEYLAFKHSVFEIGDRQRTEVFEMGNTGSALSFAVDLLGAMCGAVGALIIATEMHPYCATCNKYLRSKNKYSIVLRRKSPLQKKLLAELPGLMTTDTYQGIVDYITGLSQAHATKGVYVVHFLGSEAEFFYDLDGTTISKTANEGDVCIQIDQRDCPSCREGAVLGVTQRFHKRDKQWHEIEDLKFTIRSKPFERHSTSRQRAKSFDLVKGNR